MEIEPILRPDPNLYAYWMLPVLILCALSIAYVRVAYTKRIQLLIRSTLRLQILRQVLREELLFSHRASILLFLNFILSAGLILYAVSTYYQVQVFGLLGIQRFAALTLLVLGVYLLKFFGILFLRWLYNDQGVLREYLFEVFSVCKSMGLFLLPLGVIIITVNVGDVPLWMGITGIVSLVFLLLRTAQGLALSFSSSISRIYIILYLCSLEIMPFLLLLSFVWKSMI